MRSRRLSGIDIIVTRVPISVKQLESLFLRLIWEKSNGQGGFVLGGIPQSSRDNSDIFPNARPAVSLRGSADRVQEQVGSMDGQSAEDDAFQVQRVQQVRETDPHIISCIGEDGERSSIALARASADIVGRQAVFAKPLPAQAANGGS